MGEERIGGFDSRKYVKVTNVEGMILPVLNCIVTVLPALRQTGRNKQTGRNILIFEAVGEGCLSAGGGVWSCLGGICVVGEWGSEAPEEEYLLVGSFS